MTDAIADMLNRIHTGSLRGHGSVSFPARKSTEAVASVLMSEGYITSYAKKGKKAHKHIEVEIKYIAKETPSGREARVPALKGFRRLSKSSRRMYVGVRDITPAKDGIGIRVLSTPGGILTGAEARRKGIGGELLFEVW